MTYNFDIDRWYENQLEELESRRRRGEIDDEEYEKTVQELDRRHAEMWDRLGRSYQIPDAKQ